MKDFPKRKENESFFLNVENLKKPHFLPLKHKSLIIKALYNVLKTSVLRIFLKMWITFFIDNQRVI